MELPKFLLGDNTEHPEDIFIIHTDYPRFILNLANDEVVWLEEFDAHDKKELEQEAIRLFQLANDFYDREIERYQ